MIPISVILMIMILYELARDATNLLLSPSVIDNLQVQQSMLAIEISVRLCVPANILLAGFRFLELIQNANYSKSSPSQVFTQSITFAQTNAGPVLELPVSLLACTIHLAQLGVTL